MKRSISRNFANTCQVLVILTVLVGIQCPQALGSSQHSGSFARSKPTGEESKATPRSSTQGLSYDVLQAGLTRDPNLDSRIRRGQRAEENKFESESKKSKLKKNQKQIGPVSQPIPAPYPDQSMPTPDEPKVTISGSVGMSVFLYETDKAFTPDFLADSAKIGLSGEDGPFKGELEASLADKGSDVGISKANVSGRSSFGSELKFGRASLPGVNAYLANLNIYPFGLGVGDGLLFSQDLSVRQDLSLTAGGGVVNALAGDVSVGFDKRAASEFRGYFGFVSAKAGSVLLKGLYGTQRMLMTAADDRATPGFNEEKGADFELFELSLGLEFEQLSFGGFYSQKNVGSESYFLENQAPAPVPPLGASLPILSESFDVVTFGGGVGYKHPLSIFLADSEFASVNAGYSQQSKQLAEGEPTETSLGLTFGYSVRSLTTSLNYGHYRGPAGFYADSVTGNSFASADRFSIGASYKFSK